MKDREKQPNTTEYGEFVCSYFSWLPLDFQKENAEVLCSLTNKKNDNYRKGR